MCNAVVDGARIHEDRSKSWLVNVYKSKWDVLVRGIQRQNVDGACYES